jgi:hypothetical protein
VYIDVFNHGSLLDIHGVDAMLARFGVRTSIVEVSCVPNVFLMCS